MNRTPHSFIQFKASFTGKTVDEALVWLELYFKSFSWDIEKDEWDRLLPAVKKVIATRYLEALNASSKESRKKGR